MIDGGYCGLDPTSVIDMSGDETQVLRQGLGDTTDFVGPGIDVTDSNDNMTQDPVDPQQGSDIGANETASEALLRVSSAVEKRMGQPQQG